MDFLHIISGKVSLKCSGGFPERFVNLCTAYGIELWNIRKIGEVIYADTTPEGFLKIRKPAKASGMKIKMQKKTGLPFLVNRYRNRIGIGIGVLIFVAGMLLLSGRVWLVEVSGNTSVSSSRIMQAVEESGLEYGMKISKINSDVLNNSVSKKIPELSWITLNTRGCKVVVEVREAVSKPKLTLEKGYANIIASKDGQIEIIEPYRGTAVKKPGETVTGGGLLISGANQSRIETPLYCYADGYVVARTGINVQSVQADENPYEYKQKTVYSIYFFGLDISLSHIKNGDIIYRQNNRVSINNVVLPIGYTATTYTVKTENRKAVSPEFKRLTAMNKYALESYNRTLHTQIVSSDVRLTEKDGITTVNGSYVCFENICETVDFEIEETGNETEFTE